MDTDELDIQKLHTESLQLRNQQFYLGTLALAGSGLTAWVVPGIAATKDDGIMEPVLLVATFSWLGLLLFLYCWSLALRRMIVIISKYLEIKNGSFWESNFRKLQNRDNNLYSSQTNFVAIAFTLYGVVAVSGAVVAAFSADNIRLSDYGCIGLLSSLIMYVFLLWKLLRDSRVTDEVIKNEWDQALENILNS